MHGIDVNKHEEIKIDQTDEEEQTLEKLGKWEKDRGTSLLGNWNCEHRKIERGLRVKEKFL